MYSISGTSDKGHLPIKDIMLCFKCSLSIIMDLQGQLLCKRTKWLVPKCPLRMWRFHCILCLWWLVLCETCVCNFISLSRGVGGGGGGGAPAQPPPQYLTSNITL